MFSYFVILLVLTEEDVEEQIEELQSEIDARQRIEKVFTGNETNAKIQLLLERVASLAKEKQDLTEKVYQLALFNF